MDIASIKFLSITKRSKEITVLERKLVRCLQVGMLSVFLLICGCGGEPYTYESNSELKTGPGLFSGEAGQITIFEQRPEQEPEKPEEAEKKE